MSGSEDGTPTVLTTQIRPRLLQKMQLFSTVIDGLGLSPGGLFQPKWFCDPAEQKIPSTGKTNLHQELLGCPSAPSVSARETSGLANPTWLQLLSTSLGCWERFKSLFVWLGDCLLRSVLVFLVFLLTL